MTSKTFKFNVSITCSTADQAQKVITERLGFDEDYGFDYTIDVEDVGDCDCTHCGEPTNCL